jgi:cyclophilin family peptidyl-prolyl cis-trans isomerase
MRARVAFIALSVALVLAACTAEATPSPAPACPSAAPTSVSAQATLEGAEVGTVTVSGHAEGEFSMELYGDQAPLATANFVALARCGFYDGIKFHRVLAGFVVQAGDPNTENEEGDFVGIGTGGPGYQFEIEPPAEGLTYGTYAVAMANAAPTVPDSNGSQFFITLDDLDDELRESGVYTIFGQVISGTDVVDAIATAPITDPRGIPAAPVVIESIVISAASGTEPSAAE